MNAAFLLVTTWVTGAGPAPVVTATPATSGAPVASAPLTSTPLPGPAGSCCGGAYGGGAYGGAGACCETSCGCGGGGGGLFSHFRNKHRGGGCCDTCGGGAISGGIVSGGCGCETSCGCGGGGGGFFSHFRNKHGGGGCCDTCGTIQASSCGCETSCGCGGGGGGFFSHFRNKHRGGGACCDTCGGGMVSGGCGSGCCGSGAPVAPGAVGTHPPYGTSPYGTSTYGTPGPIMPPAESIGAPKDLNAPGKKMPKGGNGTSQITPAPLDVPLPANSKANETETKSSPFELDRRYESRVGRAADYSHLTGQLYYVHADGGTWVLRYAPLWKEDPNGGSVVLARDRQLDSYREGDLVTVHGEILQPKGSPHLGGPLYRVREITLDDRSQQ